jgi:hypothetical protein
MKIQMVYRVIFNDWEEQEHWGTYTERTLAEQRAAEINANRPPSLAVEIEEVPLNRPYCYPSRLGPFTGPGLALTALEGK